MTSTEAGLRGHSGHTNLIDEIRAAAHAVGFDAVHVTSVDAIDQASAQLASFLDAGRHGDMEWMASTAERRSSPRQLWPEARSAIMLGMNYGPDRNPLDDLADQSRGIIASYAKGRDYHDVVKPKLKEIAGLLQRRSGADVKVFVDTAPLMEKPLAAAAGLGWQGKHTNLVSGEFASWLVLGAILTTAELPSDPAGEDQCGSCRRCLDICPTDAFPAPYQLDARRCISYLTIEHKGHIPREFRPKIGNRIFGCDDCLAVCPWNKFASRANEARLHARDEVDNPPLAELLQLDDAEFRQRFRGTPVKRSGRDRFLRNVLIAAGNSGDREFAHQITGLLGDPSEMVRAMAVWALSRLLHADAFASLRDRHAPSETDADVRDEWTGTASRQGTTA